jgi:hypothetical protein
MLKVKLIPKYDFRYGSAIMLFADYVIDVINMKGEKIKFSFDTNDKKLFIVTTSHGTNGSIKHDEEVEIFYSNKQRERELKIKRILNA